MHNFIKPFVAPVLKRRGWNRLCEIGSREGEATDILRGIPNLEVTVVDPCLDCDLRQKFADNSSIDMRKGLSLDVLQVLGEPFNCILIDGDHNWYTVYNELRLISERNLLMAGGIIFLHDVEWPWARRDLYYQPETIPEKYRHQYANLSIARGRSELSGESGPFAGGFKATHEGGARNGVLTAIEDFLRENPRKYRFFRARVGNGLGILLYRGTLRDDCTFLFLMCKGLIYSAAYNLMRITGLRAVRQPVNEVQGIHEPTK